MMRRHGFTTFSKCSDYVGKTLFPKFTKVFLPVHPTPQEITPTPLNNMMDFLGTQKGTFFFNEGFFLNLHLQVSNPRTLGPTRLVDLNVDH